EWQNLAANEIEVAHAIEVLVVCHTRCAIAETDLGAEIEADLAATVSRLAPERLASAPLVRRKGPLNFGPNRAERTRCRAAVVCWLAHQQRKRHDGPAQAERGGDGECERLLHRNYCSLH